MFTVACVVGARPNFVKIAPIMQAFHAQRERMRAVLVHTGQHYDKTMSDVFFAQLNIPHPDVHLNVEPGSHGKQTGQILDKYEEWLLTSQQRPDATLVVGDVNSTMACALASTKLHIPVIHVEAGLRSYDRTMPEEINRLVTDSISNLLLVSEPSGVDNLRAEGRPEEAVVLVGNVMIDVLKSQLSAAQELNELQKHGVTPHGYLLWTMHRPSNVDQIETLQGIANVLVETSQKLPIVFPVHPRTKSKLEAAGFWKTLDASPHVHLTIPLGYREFLCLSSQAAGIVTDSGGPQEESTVLGIPCLALGSNTERPVTVSQGTRTLVGQDTTLLERGLDEIIAGTYKVGTCPALWDGHAGERNLPTSTDGDSCRDCRARVNIRRRGGTSTLATLKTPEKVAIATHPPPLRRMFTGASP